MDVDGDRKVTKAEFKTWWKETQKVRLPKRVWAEMDQNKDGYLEWYEFNGPKGTGTEADRAKL